MNKLKTLDLFSGIGGFSLGLERTGGFETIAFCEIDKFCQKVLKKHWKDIPIFPDITKLKKKDLPDDIDVICGGFPCQDISCAGKGAGIEGRRSGLWKDYFRLIKEIKPKFVIIENVANLRSKGLAEVLKDVWSIGYDCEWHILSASAFGAHHKRERCWIIAYSNINTIWNKQQRSKIGWDNIQNEGKAKPRGSHQDGLMAHSKGQRIQRLWSCGEQESHSYERPILPLCSRERIGETKWETEPELDRVVDGLPDRVDRVKSLGNAIVPQIATYLGNEILSFIKKG